MDRLKEMNGSREGRFLERAEGRGLHISPLAPLPSLCFLLLGAKEMLLAGLAVALLHELAHIGAIYLTGGRVIGISLEPFGGQIYTDGRLCSYRDSLLISCAGIAVNLLSSLLLFIKDLPDSFFLFALCSLAMGLFNLFPFKGLDGGDILSNLLLLRFSQQASEKVCFAVSLLALIPLCFFTVYSMAFSIFNPTLLLLTCYLIFTLI